MSFPLPLTAQRKDWDSADRAHVLLAAMQSRKQALKQIHCLYVGECMTVPPRLIGVNAVPYFTY